ncbi:hypothetical protein CKA32_003658 [Geitlerinema sp. FC II]|nr:hypothetical protein CKA32_003658 [Geitlerinema sp. FC II]
MQSLEKTLFESSTPPTHSRQDLMQLVFLHQTNRQFVTFIPY